MIETTPERSPRADLSVPASVATAVAGWRGEIAARSQVVWGEHCSECAYPACYAHCSFYTPRSDGHCRRFLHGFERMGDGLHRIRFRKWGKLEGRGPVSLRPVSEAAVRERRDEHIAGLIAHAPLPHAVQKNLSWRWNVRKTAAADGPPADAFVVEAWAADGRTHAFTLSVLDADKAGAMHQSRFDVGPEPSRHVVSVAEIAARVDLSRPYLIQIEPVGEAAGRDVVFGLCDFVAWREAAAPTIADLSEPPAEKPVKVVVWDLDETLWHGTLAEDGPDGVRVRPEAEALIRALDERGVLQSVASKNDAPLAAAALERAGLSEFFLHPQVSWNPKSDALARIATALDLGLDSFVFIDDQPFERAEVTAAHPQVRAVTHEDVGALIAHRWFDLPVTPESRARRGMYRAEATRVQAAEAAGTDYLAFLRASGMRIDLRPLDRADVERVHELSQRSNQLNFLGAKLTREQTAALIGGPMVALTVRCADRFGDYGLVGFVTLEPGGGRIGDLFMSCRVQRKRVEHALFGWLAQTARAAGAGALTARWRPLERNGASRDMLASLGFTAGTADDAGVVTWTLAADTSIEDADVVPVLWAGASIKEAA